MSSLEGVITKADKKRFTLAVGEGHPGLSRFHQVIQDHHGQVWDHLEGVVVGHIERTRRLLAVAACSASGVFSLVVARNWAAPRKTTCVIGSSRMSVRGRSAGE